MSAFTTMHSFLLSLLLILLFPSPLPAYNFLYIHPTKGTPIKWDNTKPIRYYLDPGKLGRLTNDQAHTLLKEAMKIWENASPNAKVPHFEFAGLLPEDVNGTNYRTYVGSIPCNTKNLSSCKTEYQKNLQTVIIFDDDGSIRKEHACPIGGCFAVADADVFADEQIPTISRGYAVFGPVGDAGPAVALFVHELGHMLGLAHTYLNQQLFLSSLDIKHEEENALLPIMMSLLIGKSPMLNPDDIAGISILYPSDDFFRATGTIKGTIAKSDGSPMMHVNVIARNIQDPLCEAYSMLSGRFCPEGFENDDSLRKCFDLRTKESVPTGSYALSGLPPGNYTVEVEEVAHPGRARMTAPGLLDKFIFGDAEFWNEEDVADEPNTKSSTITLKGGDKRENINIILNRNSVTSDRIKYIPGSTFTRGPETKCPVESTVNYAKMIGLDDTNESQSSGGCSLLYNANTTK